MRVIDKVIEEIKEGKWDGKIWELLIRWRCPIIFGFAEECKDDNMCRDCWERELTEREKKLLKAVDAEVGE